MKCPNCGQIFSDEFEVCWSCGTVISKYSAQPSSKSDHIIQNRSYNGYSSITGNPKGNRRKTDKIRIIVISAIILLIIGVIILGVFVFDFSNANNSGITSFYSDEEYMIKGEKCSITFYAESDNGLSGLSLFSKKKLSDMNDNGQNGDVKANDGIYSVTIPLKEDNKNEIEFYAKTKDFTSKKIKIHFFDKPNKNTRNQVISYQNRIDNIESKYLVDGYVETDDIQNVLNEVEKYAKKLVQYENALLYEKTESSIIIKLSNGLTIAYSPKIKGTYSIDNGTRMTVNTYQPYYKDVKNSNENYISLPKGINAESELINAAAKEVYSNFSNYSMGNIAYDNQVCLSTIKNFGKNQIILWQGHGTYGGKNLHSLIYTGADFNWDAFNLDLSYFLDCCQDRILEYGNQELFSYKYVDKYCNDLENTFIYLGPCESGADDTLANTFIKKGAAAVIGNSKSILRLYGDLMEYTTTHYLTQINKSTGNYYTLNEALNAAKQKYGNNDSKYNTGLGSEPTIFGGENAKNYRLADYDRNIKNNKSEKHSNNKAHNNTNTGFKSGKNLLYLDNKLICADSNAIYCKDTIDSKGKKIAIAKNVSSLLSDGQTVYYAVCQNSFGEPSDPRDIYFVDVDKTQAKKLFSANGSVNFITCLNNTLYYTESIDYGVNKLMKYDLETNVETEIVYKRTGDKSAGCIDGAYCLDKVIYFTKNHSLCLYSITDGKFKKIISSSDGRICETIGDRVYYYYSKNGKGYISIISSDGTFDTSVPISKDYNLQAVTNNGKYGLFFKGYDNGDFNLYTIDLKTGSISTSKGDAGFCKGKNYFITKDLKNPDNLYFMYSVRLFDETKKTTIAMKHDKFDIDITKPMCIIDGYIVDCNLKTYKIYSSGKNTLSESSKKIKTLYSGDDIKLKGVLNSEKSPTVLKTVSILKLEKPFVCYLNDGKNYDGKTKYRIDSVQVNMNNPEIYYGKTVTISGKVMMKYDEYHNRDVIIAGPKIITNQPKTMYSAEILYNESVKDILKILGNKFEVKKDSVETAYYFYNYKKLPGMDFHFTIEGGNTEPVKDLVKKGDIQFDGIQVNKNGIGFYYNNKMIRADYDYKKCASIIGKMDCEPSTGAFIGGSVGALGYTITYPNYKIIIHFQIDNKTRDSIIRTSGNNIFPYSKMIKMNPKIKSIVVNKNYEYGS